MGTDEARGEPEQERQQTAEPPEFLEITYSWISIRSDILGKTMNLLALMGSAPSSFPHLLGCAVLH